MSLGPNLVERFRADLERAAGRSGEDGRIALAVSGGADSMAMLALAHAAFPERVAAATVDHGLRAEAEAEAAMVARCCAALGVPHATLRADLDPDAGNLQARAREARYALLLGWAEEQDAAMLCTAHHLDDQAETFLMRAARGAGAPGLAAIRRRRQAGAAVAIVRPLLDWRRAELRRAAEAAGLAFVDDPSNRDPRFDRTRARALLAATGWLDPVRLAAAAAHAAEAEDALADLAQRFWRERAAGEGEGEVRIDMAGLPRELRRRLARWAIDRVRAAAGIGEGRTWRADRSVESLLDALEAGAAATRAGVLASAEGSVWRFRAAPPRRPHRSAR